jgi:DNA processing protein
MASRAAGPEAQLHWLALHLIPGLGARNSLRLVQIFGHPERVFHASLTELRAAAPRLPVAVGEAIHAGTSFEDAADEQRNAAALGVEVIPFQDPRYPERLKQIYDPPMLLYARGNVELLGEPSIAVVGTRYPTAYGRTAAEKLSRDLAAAGVTHVSGMARGIDAASHRGALQAGDRTIAVLGTGVDHPYPRENTKLYEKIIERGLVVSEFRLGTTPFPQNFPLRNRIISGATLATLVVEGAQYSGSLITARLALDQGRDVFAVPGNIVSKQSWGPNLLIKDGAKLIQDVSDMLEELPPDVLEQLQSQAASGAEAEAPDEAAVRQCSPAAQRVFSHLRLDEALHVDEMIRVDESCSPSEVLAALSELELFGVAKQLPGKHFVRVWQGQPGPRTAASTK